MAKKLEVVLTGDSRGVSKAFGDVERRAGGFQSKMAGIGAKVGRAVSVGLAGGAVAFGAFVAGGLKSLANIEKIRAQTESVIKSTGGAAGVSSKHIDDYAQALEKKTGIEAESITTGQNLLLTFTDIRNSKLDKTFDKATATALDMSVALGTDMKSSSLLVGKALNDPIKGLTALSRVGVAFTQQQKDQIKAMSASGDTLGAQKIILAELNKEFGGSADAFGKTTSGKVAKLKNAFGDVQEEIAAKLLPVGLKLLTWAAKSLPGALAKARTWFASLQPAIRSVGDRLRAVGDAVAPVVKAIARFVKANPKPVLIGFAVALGVVTAAWTAMAIAETAALWPIYAIVAAIALVAGGLVYAYQKVGWFHDAVDAVGAYLRDVLWPVIVRVAQVVGEKLSAAFQWASQFAREVLVPALQLMWSWFAEKVLPVLQRVADFYTTTMAAAFRVGADAVGWIVDKLPGLYDWFSTYILPIIKNVTDYLVGSFSEGVKTSVAWIQRMVEKLMVAYNWFSTYILPTLKTVGDFMSTVFVDNLRAARQGLGFLIDKAASLWKWMTDLMDKASVFGETIKGALNGATGGLGGTILGFANGGSPPVGVPYLVGENGPELRIDTRPGVIIPNDKLRAAAAAPMAVSPTAGSPVGSGGSTTVVIQLDGREISRRVINTANGQTRRTGRSPLVAGGRR